MTVRTTTYPRTSMGMMRRSAVALVALALTVAACDSGAEEPLSLIGNWDAQTNVLTRFAVVSETQTAVDLNRPGTGGVSVTGGVVGTLDHLAFRARDEDGAFSLSLTTGPYPRPDRPMMALAISPTNVTLAIQDGHASTPRFYVLPYSAPPPLIVLGSGSVEISNVVLVSADERLYPGSVVVNGSLVFPTIQYVAGEERPLQVLTGASSTFPGEEGVEFDPDGAFRGFSTRWLAAGTWTTPREGEVQVQTEDPRYGSASYTYAYDFEGESLVLGSRQDVLNPGTAICLSQYETRVGFRPGTLVAVRDTFETTYSRVAP